MAAKNSAIDSAEYRTLVQLTGDIEVALSDHLVEIGSSLVSSGLITPTQAKDARNQYNPAKLRAAELVGFIQKKVQQNSQHYSTFIGVLEKDVAVYTDILKKLKEKHTSLDIGGQPPPPTRDSCNDTDSKFKTGILRCTIIFAVFAVFLGVSSSFNSASAINYLPSNITEFLGREKHLRIVNTYIKNNEVANFINVYGPPGIGKSELAIHIGRQLLTGGSNVCYIDLNKTNSIFSLNDNLSWYLYEPQRIQLLILDNADHYWSGEVLMNVLNKYVNKLNILITSRKQITVTHNIMNNVLIPLNESTVSDCVSLIVSVFNDPYGHANQICLQFNSIPLAVLLAIGPLKHNQMRVTSHELLADYQNQQLNLFMPLDQSVNGTATFIAAAFLWNIKNLVLNCHWYLVQSIDNSSLDELLLSNQGGNWEYCIQEFAGHLLLFIDEMKRYHFQPFTKELVKLLKNGSQLIQVNTQPGIIKFWENFFMYHMDSLVHFLEDTKDLELAIKIGSNQNITNNLLPLLSQSFNITPLLYSASTVIEARCSDGEIPLLHNVNISDMIYAIGYLYRALFCPAVSTISLLRDPNYRSNSACVKCLDKVSSCLQLVNSLHREVAGSTEAMEAHAFYLRLFGTNAKICNSDWDYRWHLIDLASMVSFAKRNYESKFHNPKAITDIEVGLEMYSHMNIAETKRKMQSVLNGTVENDQCNFAIKMIAIMVLHNVHFHEQDFNDNDIVSLHKQISSLTTDIEMANTTCFASAYHELFIPFLKSVGQNTSKLEQSQNELEHFFSKKCHAQSRPIDECYRKRYDLSHGTYLFTAEELTTEVLPIFIHLQEPLLCSLLRDIALDCPSTQFPSPELVISARKARTKGLVEGLKPLFPDPLTFAQVEDSFLQNPLAYQYYYL